MSFDSILVFFGDKSTSNCVLLRVYSAHNCLALGYVHVVENRYKNTHMSLILVIPTATMTFNTHTSLQSQRLYMNKLSNPFV